MRDKRNLAAADTGSAAVFRLAPVCLAVLALGLIACIEERVIFDSWGDLKAISDESKAEGVKTRKAREESGAGSYGIQMVYFEGDNHARRARILADRLTKENGLSAVWVRTVEQRSSIMFGRYPDPNTFNAQEDLSRVKEIALDGMRPFTGAVIIGLTATGIPEAERLELRNNPGDYTLQVGFYDRHLDGDFRKAAENAAMILRRQGHQAYFYHSPDQPISIVLVGVFYHHDLIPLGGGEVEYSADIRDLQARFPHNLDNGKVDPVQISRIVPVPR
jgi:hypothetical protein